MFNVDLTAVVSLLLRDGVWHTLSSEGGGGITVSEGIEFERDGETVSADGIWLCWTENTPTGSRRVFASASSVLGIGT